MKSRKNVIALSDDEGPVEQAGFIDPVIEGKDDYSGTSSLADDHELRAEIMKNVDPNEQNGTSHLHVLHINKLRKLLYLFCILSQ